MNFPCKECITLGICKAKAEVECTLTNNFCLYTTTGPSVRRMKFIKSYLNKDTFRIVGLTILFVTWEDK